MKLIKDQNNTAAVHAYMLQLEHPLKAEMEAVREIIKGSDAGIKERIKWNAPSFFNKEDLVTFHPRATKHVHLVFHHPFIINIASAILEGNYKDRRMVYFRDMAVVQANKQELERIMQELIKNLNSNL